MKKLICFISSFVLCSLFLFGCAPSEYREVAKQANEIFEEDYNNDKVIFEAKATSEAVVVTLEYQSYKNLEEYQDDIDDIFSEDLLINEYAIMQVYSVVYSELEHNGKLIIQMETRNGDVLYQFEYNDMNSFRENKIDNVH